MKKINAYLHSWLIACLLPITLLSTSCQPQACLLEPHISYTPPLRFIESLPSAFTCLSTEERQQDWAKEYQIGIVFARELDLYRAITAFKRSLILFDGSDSLRRQQIEYCIILSYYLGKKYGGVIESFEESSLTDATPAFPAFKNMLLMLYEAYSNLNLEEKAQAVFLIIEKFSPETAENLEISDAILQGDLATLAGQIPLRCDQESLDEFIATYSLQKKSVRRAQVLNGLLPGAGYLYVGQKKTALTSFLINAVFTLAAYQFYHRGYIAAGIVATSLEYGWYVGGINGAGLAAKEYNESLYNATGKALMAQNRLFPVLMFETAF